VRPFLWPCAALPADHGSLLVIRPSVSTYIISAAMWVSHVAAAGLVGGTSPILPAAMLGVACALFGTVLSPDHVCTIMSLTADTDEGSAFRVGGSWGLAHSLGTVLVCGLLQGVRSSGQVNLELWEHYGDYLVGCSLILCGLYFAARESAYLVQQADGSVLAQPCACPAHLFTGAPERASLIGRGSQQRQSQKSKPKMGCRSAFQAGASQRHSQTPTAAAAAAPAEGGGQLQESTPLMGSTPAVAPQRVVGSAMLGFVQGLCCPAVLVSLNLYSAYVYTAQATAAFLVAYACVSCIATAVLAYGWTRFAKSQLRTALSDQTVYRACWGMTILLGLVWIVACHLHAVDMLEGSTWLQTIWQPKSKAAASPAPAALMRRG